MPFNEIDRANIINAVRNTPINDMLPIGSDWIGKWAIFHNNRIVKYKNQYVFDTAVKCRARLKIYVKNELLRSYTHLSHNDSIHLSQRVYVNNTFNFVTLTSGYTEYSQYSNDLYRQVRLRSFDPQLLNSLQSLFEVRQVVASDVNNFLNELRQQIM